MRNPNRGYEVSKTKVFILVCMVAFLAFSAYPQGGGIATVPAEVAKQEEIALADDAASYVKPGNVTVNFKDADIAAVLNYLSEVSGVDIVTSPDVTGTVTLRLTDKPWDVALDIIVKNYGYAYEREGNIIRVVTLDSLKQAELSTEVIHLNYTTADEAQEAVKDMLTDRGKLTYDARTNTLLITDLPTNTYKIRQIMDKIDKKTPQVMIQARILETILEDDERMGIDWNLKIAAIGAARPTTLPFTSWGDLVGEAGDLRRFFPFGQTGATTAELGSGGAGTLATTGTADFPANAIRGDSTPFPFVDADQFTYGTLDFSQFSAVLELLKRRRSTEVVSNPRITTLNHKEAKILVGRVYNFPTFDQSELTGQWVISGYQAKELGIKLVVTPHVNKNNEIVVELQPEISNFLGMEKISDELSAPLWSMRVADTQVMVGDGETIFIGGLVSENNIDVEKKVPLLGDLFGDIPFIGGLVKNTIVEKEKKELIFFITVHIVDDVKKLTRIIAKDLTDTTLPDDIIEEQLEEVEKADEVIVELPAKAKKSNQEKKKHEPLFNFRKW